MRRTDAPPLSRRGRAWSLAAAAACLLPLLLQLPATLATAALTVALATGALSWRQRPPRGLSALLALVLAGTVLAAFGFRLGRDVACALLAVMLALKPVELATLRDARSLVGFALFAPFSTFLLDQGPLSLLFGLLGAVLALAALLQLADEESGMAAAASAHSPVPAVLRLLGVGLPLALSAFWLFPRIASPLWGVPERVLARPGLSDEMAPGEWLEMLNDDRPALRVSFHGPVPPPSQMYWRGPVLLDFDGRTWRRAHRTAALPAAATTRAGEAWSYVVEVEPTERRTVPALELPQAVPAGTRQSWDLVLEADARLTSVTRWQMRSQAPASVEPTLSAQLRRQALALPPGFNPRTVALARQWRQRHGPDGDAAIVDRAMQMIRSEFGYTLSTPLPGRHSADEFLFDWKQGFCEHYSSAFVILMRAAGIPARVVTGYAGGRRNAFGDYWIVRQEDAHAWAEVWLEGRGWVRADPTAAVAPERIYDTLDDRAGGGLAGLPGVAPMRDLGDWLRRGWNDLVLGFDATRQMALLRPLGLDGAGARGLVALFAASACLALGWMLWLTARAERSRDPVLRAWRRLGRRYARLGLGRESHEPAQQWTARVAAARPQDAAALEALGRRFAGLRYAPGGNAQELRQLARDLRRHRPA